jgi:hypothetical protein
MEGEKLKKNTTIDQILKGYPEMGNIAELLDSDILVLPLHKNGAFGEGQQFGIKNDKLKIKYYTDDKPAFRFEASVDTLINLGILIVSSIAALVVLADSIQRNHKGDIINITINVNSGNNVYINKTFVGYGSDVGREILDLKENLK